jgi:hypothetical protein
VLVPWLRRLLSRRPIANSMPRSGCCFEFSSEGRYLEFAPFKVNTREETIGVGAAAAPSRLGFVVPSAREGARAGHNTPDLLSRRGLMLNVAQPMSLKHRCLVCSLQTQSRNTAGPVEGAPPRLPPMVSKPPHSAAEEQCRGSLLHAIIPLVKRRGSHTSCELILRTKRTQKQFAS